MNRFIAVDPARCIGCNTCMAGCSAVHRAQGLQSQPRLTVTRIASITAPATCHQCDDAPCARVCPVEAIWIGNREVVLEESRCIGCKLCGIACPFGAITPSGTSISGGLAGPHVDQPQRTAELDPILAWDAGIRTVAVKCDLCNFSPNGPECVRVCPTDALRLVDKDDTGELNAAKRRASVVSAAVSQQLHDIGPGT